MAKRRCLECPALVDVGTSRCPKHERARDKARGTRQQRGYDAGHDQLRADWQRRLDAGLAVYCWRPECGQRIDPTHWHLGHDDHDRSIYRGPECPSCNLATASRH